jgi:small subunit ribosomal protein S16
MVRMRLRRVGKRKQPIYRVVVADSRSPRDGRFIEVIGQYKPLNNPSEIALDEEKALDWLRKGAQPSGSVTALLKRTGVWSTFVADKGPAKRPPTKRRKAAAEVRAKADAEAAKAAADEAAAGAEPASQAAEAPAETAEAPAQEVAAEESAS